MITFKPWIENENVFAIFEDDTYIGRMFITPDEIRFRNMLILDSSKYLSPDTLVKLGVALNNKIGYKEFVMGAEK